MTCSRGVIGAAHGLMVIEADSERQAVAELRESVAVFKRGKRTVTRQRTELHRPT